MQFLLGRPGRARWGDFSIGILVQKPHGCHPRACPEDPFLSDLWLPIRVLHRQPAPVRHFRACSTLGPRDKPEDDIRIC
jgi:hypothetical protein